MSVTGLGMPALPPRTTLPPWKQAWDTALYGEQGYLRRHPATLRTDTGAVLDLICSRVDDHREVVLLGPAGALAPQLVDRRPDLLVRPDLPAGFAGLVAAVDWLARVPAHVVVADDDGVPRVAHVDPATGQEALGLKLADAGVPTGLREWQERHWPLPEPFTRAEVGTTRESAWAQVVDRVGAATLLAIEDGHVAGARPPGGSLRTPGADVPLPDGRHDLLAGVALDALATSCDGVLVKEHGLQSVEVRRG